jgi:hypothetical protein
LAPVIQLYWLYGTCSLPACFTYSLAGTFTKSPQVLIVNLSSQYVIASWLLMIKYG